MTSQTCLLERFSESGVFMSDNVITGKYERRDLRRQTLFYFSTQYVDNLLKRCMSWAELEI